MEQARSLKIAEEPDWECGCLYDELSPFNKVLDDEVTSLAQSYSKESDSPLQQSDLLKPFLLDISNWGLNYAYHKYYGKQEENPEKYKHTKTTHPTNVIIIGAGMSGLVAGYELAQVGHNITILEMQHRVGGRVKTISDSHFLKGSGLWSDSGAMRLPGTGEPGSDGPSHFMTDFYAQHFELPVIPFVNSDPNGYYKFYDQPAIQMSEWAKDPGKYCDQFWPGWDKHLKEAKPDFKQSLKIKDIGSYFEATMAPIMNQLRKWWAADPKTAWRKWINKWAQFSVVRLLRSTYTEVKLALQQNQQFAITDDNDLAVLDHLLPWPIEAVVAYSTYTYIGLECSLVEYLRGDLGQWGKDHTHSFKDGLSMLPEAFIKKNKQGWNKKVELSQNIFFGVSAHTIEYSHGHVKVICRNETTMQECVFEGDRVIITLPINIIRGLNFSPPLPGLYYQAFENIYIEPSTKIMLQCHRRFWQDEGIQGGFSKTNMPISQLYYPSNPEFKIPNDERGILMCYTWKSEALLFGSQTPEKAISEAVKEVAKIHPQITKEFEVGVIQSWYDDPSAQGAFCLLKPEQYIAVRVLMMYPYQSIYFCGEAISYANRWIQGSLKSGLRAAYELFVRNEKLHSGITSQNDSKE